MSEKREFFRVSFPNVSESYFAQFNVENVNHVFFIRNISLGGCAFLIKDEQDLFAVDTIIPSVVFHIGDDVIFSSDIKVISVSEIQNGMKMMHVCFNNFPASKQSLLQKLIYQVEVKGNNVMDEFSSAKAILLRR